MRIFKNHWKTILIIFITLLFPLIVSLFYKIPCEQVLPVELGDLLNYYGLALGLIGACLTYYFENEKRRKESYADDKPHFNIKIIPKNDYFKLIITNHTAFPIRDVYCLGEFLSPTLSENHNEFEICFDKTKSELEKMNQKGIINILIEDMIDEDNLPREITIELSDDRNNRFWICSFSKRKDCERVFYYPDKTYYEEY